MREKLKDKDRLLHMIEAIDNIFEFVQGKAYDTFKSDKILQFALIKNLEIIGEAAYLLSKEFKNQHNEIVWDDIIGMRHLLVHGYYTIRNEIIWSTIEHDLKPLYQKIKEILDTKT